MKECERCGDFFDPVTVAEQAKLNHDPKRLRFCLTCLMRNLFDGLGMPTPPNLLDHHTLHPCLTEEEYQRKLRE